MKPAIIRDELRDQHNPLLKNKRKIALLAAVGLVDFSLISLYQFGVIKRLPDVPLKPFDSNKVNCSEDAYMMGLPDGPVSAGVYASTLMLASAKGTEKSGRSPWWDLAMGGAIAGNAVGAVQYLGNMIFKQKRVCPYCIAGAAINLAMLPFAYKDVKKSALKIFGRKKKSGEKIKYKEDGQLKLTPKEVAEMS